MGNYLKTITVPIPVEDKLVVIRKGERVEYEIDRTYSPEEQNTRVKRKVIGKVDPVQAGRMFPNEAYFELFPENEVPEEIRNEFLRECAIKRQMKVIRQNPEDIADQVVRGMEQMRNDTSSGLRPPSPQGEGYAVLRRVFDEIYYAIEELAGKFPNEVVVPFKVERINEVLSTLRGAFRKESHAHRGRCAASRTARDIAQPPSDATPPNPYGYLRLIEEGLTYSDVLLMLKWYKVLPR